MERILDAARALLVEEGPGGLRPTEVARRAGVPIGSIYQYFSDRHDLLAVLVDRYFTQVRAMLAASVANATSLDDVLNGLRTACARWWALHVEEPSFRPLLHAILGDPILQEANIEDSRASVRILAGALAPWVPHRRPVDLERTLLVVNHLFVPALQLALAQPPEEQRVTWEAWFGVAEGAILGLVRPEVDP